MLTSLPCFLQNSSNDLSVTNVSTNFNWPVEIRFCTPVSVMAKSLAAPFQEYAPSSAMALLGLWPAAESAAGRFFSHQPANELAVMRESRTRSIPLAARYRSLARLA